MWTDPITLQLVHERLQPLAFVLALSAMSALARPSAAQPTHLAAAPATDPATTQGDAVLDEARAIVARGEALFARSNFDAALSEFARARQLLEGHPRQYFVLHNMALCHERMFRYDQALPLYERYLREAPPDEPDRAAVAAVVQTLRGLLSTLAIQSNVEAEVWVDNRRVGDAPGEVLLSPGRHVIELRAKLYEAERRELSVGARERLRLRFELQRLSTYSGLPRLYFWTGVGLTGAALVAGTIFGARALDAQAEGERLAGLRLDPAPQEERVQNLALAADVLFGSAAVLGVTTTVLFFLTDWGTREEQAPAAAIEVAPFALRGRF